MLRLIRITLPMSRNPPPAVLAVRAFQDNYIWLICNPTPRAGDDAGRRYAAIVDPGDAEPVVDALTELNITPSAILITHRHHDHVDGIVPLVQRYAIPVYGPAKSTIPGITHTLNAGAVITVPAMDLQFQVLEIPGHTLDHIAYYGHGMLFCGDTLFGAGCGRLYDGSAAQLFAALNKLNNLPLSTQIYCGHEFTLANLGFALRVEPDNIAMRTRLRDAERAWAHQQPTVPLSLALERATNPFLRCAEPTVRAAAERFAGRPLATPEEVFAVLRYWKDTLDETTA